MEIEAEQPKQMEQSDSGLEAWVSEHALTLSLKMGHHAAASGYDRLADYLRCPAVEPFSQSAWVRALCRKALSPMIKDSGSLWYNRNSALQELDATVMAGFSQRRVVHFLYGENCYRYFNSIGKRLRAQRASIATYHTPPCRFAEVVTDTRHIRRLDAAVLMSNSQRPAFDGLLPENRLRFIPHGVDVDYYRPADNASAAAEKNSIRFFCAGHMLRDYPTLLKAVHILSEQSTPIELVIVARSEIADMFRDIKRVAVYSGISDNALLQLYQTSDALVMPLKDCTANNVLLEGMACGLGVVATDLLGVRDYTSEECRVLVEPGSAEALADAMLAVANDKDLRLKMSVAARAQALTLSWPVIARRQMELYKEVGNFS